jgi:hypothetical protein
MLSQKWIDASGGKLTRIPSDSLKCPDVGSLWPKHVPIWKLSFPPSFRSSPRRRILVTSDPIRPHHYNNQRRSQRVLLSVHILAKGRRMDGEPFAEETHTVVVNVHGASIFLKENVKPAQPLTIRNLKSGEEVPCKVVEVGSLHEGKREVGIEFLEPSRRFWRVAFPPEDWSPHSPEAKRFSGEAISFAKQKSRSPSNDPVKK